MDSIHEIQTVVEAQRIAEATRKERARRLAEQTGLVPVVEWHGGDKPETDTPETAHDTEIYSE